MRERKPYVSLYYNWNKNGNISAENCENMLHKFPDPTGRRRSLWSRETKVSQFAEVSPSFYKKLWRIPQKSISTSRHFLTRSPCPWFASVRDSWISSFLSQHFLGSANNKKSACDAGNLSLIRGSGRSPGEGNGNPLQWAGLENPTDRGAWWATVHGVAQSRTRLDS